jgi:hypothetical protein
MGPKEGVGEEGMAHTDFAGVHAERRVARHRAIALGHGGAVGHRTRLGWLTHRVAAAVGATNMHGHA